MTLPLRPVGLFATAALLACTGTQHPIDRHLSQLRPVAVAPIEGLTWPAGTLLCPLTPYQSALPSAAPIAQRVNDYLKRKRFQGDETHWSLIVVKVAPAGDDGIEQLVFNRGNYDVVNELQILKTAAETLPAGFSLQVCVPTERARVLVTRAQATHRTLIIFGTE